MEEEESCKNMNSLYIKKKSQQHGDTEGDLKRSVCVGVVWLSYVSLWYFSTLHYIKDVKSNMIVVMFVCENDKPNEPKSQPHFEL